ncbi:CRISPR-associated helicase Cas3' [Hominifimenecus sp. rT4P-3]|uniref:CRISPR-associated helicase Cas3' n=1 Tax=Hominifimenecus sp. rT4P-3 TaxID=3242979 RepID=UPI003DA60131
MFFLKDGKRYLAHIRADGQEQTVEEHASGVANRASGFAAPFGSAAMGYRVGILHDTGKFSLEFQARLHGGKRVDHATAGAREAFFQYQDIDSAMCIAGHHGGLPDLGSRLDGVYGGTLVARVHQEPGEQIPDYTKVVEKIQLPEAKPPAFSREGAFATAFYIRMLFSCLVDADFLDTESFMNGERHRGGYEDIPSLVERLQKKVEPWWEAKSAINEKRCEILRRCFQCGEGEKGLYSLTVPTGGGKTAASLAFALTHAKQHEMPRVIYIVPYVSIIEQTAEVFRGFLGEENVIEHHSNVSYQKEGGKEDWDYEGESLVQRQAWATENWDAPVIVTTAVQFFESLYANKSSKCRKLHNIGNSVLVFDEAQMIPLTSLKPCTAAIAELVKHYGCTAVLCTATQPSLGEFFAPVPIREICTDVEALFDFFQRVTYQDLGRISDEDLVARLQKEQQVLCVVNTKAEAQKLYQALQGEGCFHLSTLMTPNDRRRVIQEIRERLKMGQECRVISTSLIEAGVDLDFPTVYREFVGLDSILQAGGRCNREGKRSKTESMVFVFQTEGKVPQMFRPNVEATKYVMGRFSELNQPEAIQAYFDFLHKMREAELDSAHIMEMLEKGANGSILPLRTVAEKFRIIESETKTVYIPTEQNQNEIEQLRLGFWSKGLLRRLGQDAVNIYPNHWKKLDQMGALEMLNENAAVLSRTDMYRVETGLNLDGEEGIAWFL